MLRTRLRVCILATGAATLGSFSSAAAAPVHPTDAAPVKDRLTSAGLDDDSALAKRMAIARQRLVPLQDAHDAGAMTAAEYQAKRLVVMGDLGFIPPTRCAIRGTPYWCPHSNLLPEPLVAKLPGMPRASAVAGAVPVTAVMDHGERVPLVYVTAQGEIVKLSYRLGDCDSWSEGDIREIPLAVSRIVDIEPPRDGAEVRRSWSDEVLTYRFDPVAAHTALDAIDPSACWPAGAVHGFGKARVTFGTDGAVGLVDVESPSKDSPPFTACVGRTFGSAMVAPFQGPNVTATATFYVGDATGERDAAESDGGRAAQYRAPDGRCVQSPSTVTVEAHVSQCRAHGLSYSCARSNVLPERLQASIQRLPRTQGLPGLEVAAYEDSGLLWTRPLAVMLRDGAHVSFVYVTAEGEIVKVFDDRSQSWWTEGDLEPIPIDVSTIEAASPTPA